MAKSPRTTRPPSSPDPTPRPPQAESAAGAPEQTTTPADAPAPAPRATRARKTPAAADAAPASGTAAPRAAKKTTVKTAGKTPTKSATAKSTNGPTARKTARKSTAKTAGASTAPRKAAAPRRKATPTEPGIVTETVVAGALPVPPVEASPDLSSAAGAPDVREAPVAPVEDAGATTPEPAPIVENPPPAERVEGPAPHDRPLRILMVASEAVPFAKTGGLADVAAALPKALGALGHDVTVVMPRYRGIAVTGAPTTSFAVSMGGHQYHADVFVQETSPGVRVALVDHPAFFDRDALYGLGSHDYGDNPRRFGFLCLAALEFARLEGRAVDVVHAHDWQGGLAPVYLKTRYATDPVLGGAVSIFTIHNIAYQGLCSSEWLPQLGLGWDLFTQDGLEFWLHASLLKGGVMFADLVTTVSPKYAEELMTPQFAFGFEGILRHRAADLVGILNGVDTEVWNPAADRHLPRPYSADDLSGKADAKRVLLDTYGLPGGDEAAQRPVIAMISRMVDQKGLDLIASVAEQLPHLGAAFVVLGTGEPWYEEMWRSLARRYPDRMGVRIGFDEPLSHLIEAGADLFMMPSRFEPCGLNQMYSLRYGTLPVVRATGGLDDTVQNFDPATGAGNGFKFQDASGEALLGTLRWALHVFHNDPDRWRQLQRAGMAVDFSWHASARAYLAAYEQARTRVAGRQGATA